MDMSSSNFRPEFHMAQQSRRDKLRIQNDSTPTLSHHHSGSVGFSNMDDQIHAHQDHPLPYEYCSEMLSNFPVNSQGHVLSERFNLMAHQESASGDKRVRSSSDASSLGNFCRTIPTPNSSTMSGDPQCFSTWKSIGSQPTTDWVVHQTPIFVGDGLSASSFKLINNSPAPVESHSPPNDLSIPNYQNSLQELVLTSSNVQSLGPCAADQLRLKSQSDLISRAAEVCPQWGGHGLNYSAGRNNGDGEVNIRTGTTDNSNTQALSLSLSSVPSPKVQTSPIAEKYSQDSRNWKQENLSGNLSKVLGINAWQDLGTLARRNPGPLGPFTGYETILRSSKFLRPAQQLLDELCCFARPKNVDVHGDAAGKALEEVRVSGETVCSVEPVVRAIGDSAGTSLSVANDSSGKNREPGGLTCAVDSFQPENIQKKAKLLYMLDEVCKRYKQYHQQMQMVVTSFESVVGLSAATPYVSLALKMVSKHFRGLKTAISDQLKSIHYALGEDPLVPAGAGTSSSNKGDPSASMLKFFDQSLQKQKRSSTSSGLGGILDGQHIWRPQRGLPERAVSILRAWLFDHFLHPYPTDTDKHMLASQTGLTRNQVSNWFINARVRLWKPMVEEIHMLDSKGVAEAGKPTIDRGCNQLNNTSSTTAQSFNTVPDKQVECSNTSMWNQDKCARIEYHAPSGVGGGSLMGLMPGVEIGGLGVGAVSLTLGLRHSTENAQRAPLMQQQEHGMRSHFGSQIFPDFVG